MMSEHPATARSAWPRRLGILGMFSAMLAALAAYGSGWGFWPFRIGFLMLGIALLFAIATVVGAAICGLRRRNSTGASWLLLAGVLAALGLLFIVGLPIARGLQAPAIHDVTTDLAHPPEFGELTLRTDNLAGLAGGLEQWRQLHSAAYADIRPLRISAPREVAMARVLQIVRARGWAIAYADAQRIEATETVSPFRFKDDIIIVATPKVNGQVTQLDVRSVSRVGISDLGANARRIRALLADLAAP